MKGRAAEVIAPKKHKTKESGRKPVREKESSKVLLDEIDWVAISDERRRHEERSPKAPLKTLGTAPFNDDTAGNTNLRQEENSLREGYDLVVAVDCIYNENLVRPLVDTLAQYCPRGGKTLVWVVVELRSSDVVSVPHHRRRCMLHANPSLHYSSIHG